MKIKTKRDKEVEIKIFQNNDGGFKIVPFNDEGEKLGFLNFKFLNSSDVWLYQIAVYEDFRDQGIGSSLLEVFEYVSAVQFDRKEVIGKFAPTSFFAEEFYKANDYKIVIYRDCFPMVKKSLEKKKIKSNFETKTKEPLIIEKPKREQIKKVVESNLKTTKLKNDFSL